MSRELVCGKGQFECSMRCSCRGIRAGSCSCAATDCSEEAACEENGWDALPLAPTELTRLFPELWGTEKAAERWLSKNPLDPLISIIRLWGVLVDYKPMRQRSWSRALVRHGAEARAAISAVLGVPAEDVGVSDLTKL